MEIEKLYPRGFAANSYLVSNGGRAVLIDAAQPRVAEEAVRRGLRLEAVLLTHGHFDHTGGVAACRKIGARIGCLEAEKQLAEHHSLAREMGGTASPVRIDFTFRGGEKLQLAGMEFTVIATPGHTAGSCCFLVERALFTGDTLFEGDHGRTDLPTGNAAAMAQSLKTLFALPEDYAVYAGHGENTTLFTERGRA